MLALLKGIKITDGYRIISVYMTNWNGTNWGPDMTADILGPLKYNDEIGAYITEEHIPDLIEWLKIWESGEDEATAENLNGADDDLAEYIRAEIENRAAFWEELAPLQRKIPEYSKIRKEI